MRIENRNNKKWVTINPGEHFVSTDDIVLATLLGSCVSACLFDPVNRVSGMNHFLLSSKRYSRNMPIYLTEAGRYGIHSMEMLINKMLQKGAKKRHLKAKVFGGGNLISNRSGDNFFCVGAVNSNFVEEFLAGENIPILASSLRGEIGRVIRFHTSDYSVFVRKIPRIQKQEVIKEEHRYWEQSIKEHEKEQTEIDLW